MIEWVKYGPHKIRPWYPSPGYIDFEAKSLKSYRSKEPPSVWQAVTENKEKLITIFVCSSCFLYSSVEKDIRAHRPYCRFRDSPPGQRVYEDNDYTIREVECLEDSEKLYCQCLSLFGRFFLDTKSICFAVDDFRFYILHDKKSELVAGFFSKEKASWFNYNLACIVIFPPFQHRGLGQLLIGFSYYLTRKSGAAGSPEQPLSDFGRKTYLAYWGGEICRAIADHQGPDHLTITGISSQTGIDVPDIIATLEHMDGLSKKPNGRLFIDLQKLLVYAKKHKLPAPFNAEHVLNCN